MFSINVLADDAADKMREWHKKGLTGMRIYVKGTTVKDALLLDDPRIFPCYECAAENDIGVAVNVAAADGFDALESVLRKFPNVRFFLDHSGRPDFSAGPPFEAASSTLKLAKYPNLYLKVTSVNFLSKGKGWETPGPVLKALVSAFGASRLAWGSNYTASKGSLVELVDLALGGCADLSDEEKDWIFAKTALQLYPALARQTRRRPTQRNQEAMAAPPLE